MCAKLESVVVFLLCVTSGLNCVKKVCARPVESVTSSSDQDQTTLVVLDSDIKNRALQEAQEVHVQEVPVGDNVTLECRSNDANHNFLYWHFNDKNAIVGPPNENNYDDSKFRYEVLSGKLTIKAVSKAEEGLYNCVSRGVRKDDFNIRSVRMVVKKDWEEAFEHDPGVNLFRVVIVLTTLVVLAGFGYLAYTIWKDRLRHPSYLVPSDDEEDSGDEIFTAPGTSRSESRNIIVGNNAKDLFEGPGISTDFKSILDTANNK